MMKIPDHVAAFLQGKRLAVAGVSRQANQPANAVFRRLRDTGHEVFAINPHATELEGAPCYATLAAVPGTLDGVFIATAPAVSKDLVRQCGEQGIRRVWFHRSFGEGSVSEEAVRECEARGIEAIVGGCPMMFCGPVDVGHQCMRWWLQRSGRVPK